MTNINASHTNHSHTKVGIAGLLVTMGIVFGDIGTSPLYVIKSIVGESKAVDEMLIIGALSCVIWTLTLQTTFKYVFISLRADNNGEGGILSLYALLRANYSKWYWLAAIGAATLLADGVITPSITVVSAVEGLEMVKHDLPILPIAAVIVTIIFFIQQFGTQIIGKAFGPVMLIWFSMLFILGLSSIPQDPRVLLAFNPWYAIDFLINYPHAFWLLGAVFLCTTGAEALYSDLGHCGAPNIRISWIFVKICLIVNYMGQSAWVLMHPQKAIAGANPFYTIMPDWFVIVGVIIATFAAIIASQALISGSFTIISEAIPLNFFPRVVIKYPTEVKGQMYIPFVNTFLFVSCILVMFYFQKSSNMEAAYGLSITVTMIMTTFLLGLYFTMKKVKKIWIVLFLITFLSIEFAFLIANLRKFLHGGWFTVLLGGLIFLIIYIWYNGRNIKQRYFRFEPISKYLEAIEEMSADKEIPKFATNLVLLTRSNNPEEIEHTIIYSVINKQPKRADVYWLIHINTLNTPYDGTFKVHNLIPGKFYRIDFNLGFRISPRVNVLLRQAIETMLANNEVNISTRYESLKKHTRGGDFRFVVIDTIQSFDFDMQSRQQIILELYSVIKEAISVSDVKAFGLATSNVLFEQVPLTYETRKINLTREYD